MINKKDIIHLHDLSLNDFGGAAGIRDVGLLESAIARPFQTFAGQELYLTSIEKAAALGESLIVNHPFVDGNKRTGLIAMLALLLELGIIINANEDELYAFVIHISDGSIGFEEIVSWIKSHSYEIRQD